MERREPEGLEEKFSGLARLVEEYSGRRGLGLLKKAWEFAKLAHYEQRRINGEPVLLHALAVAQILVGWKLDVACVVAGLLHDAVEEGGATQDDLMSEFGKEICDLVAGEVRIAGIRLTGSGEAEGRENLRQMVLAMASDLRVVLIKLASRWHSLETLAALPVEERKRIGKETLEVYAPLAEMLGMGEVKGILEDLAFPYVFPREYKGVLDESRSYYKGADLRVKQAKQKVLSALAKEGIRAEAQARKKHLYSLWKKLTRSGIEGDWEKVFDVVALRVLVDSVESCYVALGVVHKMWKPVPYMGVRDFVALPKPNGYRSIHTTVFGVKGRVMEVQIRTYEMHGEAEYGMAAHWHYAEAKSKGEKDEVLEKGLVFAGGDKLRWVKQLAEWHKELSDVNNFEKAVKLDMLAQRIYVFSPRGDAYDLPVGATPVDFAYAVHGVLGRRAVGVKVNGKMVGLDRSLNSGDVVEILKSKEDKLPTTSWLSFVKTVKARREIGKHLKRGRERATIRE